MSRACGRTIARKIPIKRCDDESGKCNGSSQLDPPIASSASMPPSTTRSISNATSSPGPCCGLSEPKQRRTGKMPSPQHKPDLPLPPRRVDSCRDTVPPATHLNLLQLVVELHER